MLEEANLYRDSRIECTPDGVSIRGYYFPWGTKRIPYDTIRGIERFELSAARGRWRIWGSGDLRHWANYDPAPPPQIGRAHSQPRSPDRSLHHPRRS